MARLGIELTPTHVRAVRRDWRGTLRTSESPWQPDAPELAVDALRATMGGASSVRLAISPLLLRVKALQLPGVAPGEQWRAIALQPGRYFAESAGDTLAISWHPASQLTFATDARRLERWVRAFAALGPVTMVLPAAVALAHSGIAAGTYRVATSGEREAVATMTGGRLTHARVTRLHEGAANAPLPAAHGLSGEWQAAFGAAAAGAVEDWESLTTAVSQRALRSRRLRGFVVEAAACAAALLAALAALDYSRNADEARLDRAIAAAERDAQPGLALRRSLAGLEREAQLLRSGTGSVDAVQTLAALSELLPRTAVVTRLRMTGDEWQASGRAGGGGAAAIIPALERDSRFTDVRLTSPSTRFRENSQEFESFSLAFRVRPSD